MVASVGTLIHLYSTEYMRGDPGYGRFFLCLHFFFLSMVGLLVSDNYLQMYLFWEGVGAASYLLIGFWYQKESARRAALKAFLTNRAGDLGFMMAIFLMLRSFGTVRFTELFPMLPGADATLVTLVAGLLAWAAAAKSAQFPLHIWLPDAMEGPTPVSALIHAATMVTAGVFMLSRSAAFLKAAPAVAQILIAVGALTALGAALVASVKTDLKRVLAYSTVSHLGLMTMGLGLGATAAAVFHLATHGFFKALLFLCVGNVLHALKKHSAGVDEVGGLRRFMPFTTAAFAIGALSSAGFFPLAGFFSKDRILDAAFHHGGPLLKFVALLLSAVSAFYIFRLLFLTFLGPCPKQHAAPRQAHEPGLWMRGPVAVLALGAFAVGWFSEAFANMLQVDPAAGWATLEPLSFPVSLASAAAAALGIVAAYALCLARPEAEWEWRREHPTLAGYLEGEFGWQGFVVATVVRPARGVSSFVGRTWDAKTWDRAIEGVAEDAWKAADAFCKLATGLLNDYLWWMLFGAAALAWMARG